MAAKSRPPMSRLGHWLQKNAPRKRAAIAREARITRQYLNRLAYTTAEPTRPVMVRIARAASYVTGNLIPVTHLFDLDADPTAARLQVVAAVTRADAEAFAAEWYEKMFESVVPIQAYAAAHLVTWPISELGQDRYRIVEDEILERTFTAAKPVVADAFLRIAREVLARVRAEDRASLKNEADQ